MTAALDPSAAQRKSSRASTASRQQNAAKQAAQIEAKPGRATQNEAKVNGAKVVPLRRTATEAAIVAQASAKRAVPRSPLRETAKPATVQPLPQPQPLPLWLRGLFALQQGSMLITLLLVVAGLGVYGWTVYTQQRWSDAYRRLENLQKRERQFLTTNEVLKNQMAEQAETPGVGLVPPDPNSTIFLSPAPLRPAAAPEVAPSPDTPIPARPLGY